MAQVAQVLVLNSGSSSVKLAVVDPASGRRALTGLAERLGTREAVAVLERDGARQAVPLTDGSHATAIHALLAATSSAERDSLVALGHRVVHGGTRFTRSVLVDAEVLIELEQLVPLAPLHLPGNIAGLRAGAQELPALAQVAVFDTAFHAGMPARAARYAVPTDWHDAHGVRRYGFHGTSHRYVAAAAAALLGRPLSDLSLVTLHLGNGCSAAAVSGGRSIDTTMGFTPLEGLVMGTRSGDVDPAVVPYLAGRLGVSADEVVAALNLRSGLLGMSGRSNDMRSLLDAATTGDADAELAVDLFCYRVAKSVGALSVALGRLDAVVFTGGIGENAAPVRARVLGHLGVLGLAVDENANAVHGRGRHGRVSVGTEPAALVVPTDEELLVARDARDLVG